MRRQRRQRLGETMQKDSSPKVNTQLKYTQRKTVGGKDLTLFDVETESFLSENAIENLRHRIPQKS